MNFPLLIFLFLLCLFQGPRDTNAQINHLTYYGECINYDSQFYLVGKDTCVDFSGLHEMELHQDSTFIVELYGYKPSLTTLRALKAAEVPPCERIDFKIEKGECSPRRRQHKIDLAMKEIEYHCPGPDIRRWDYNPEDILGEYNVKGQKDELIVEKGRFYTFLPIDGGYRVMVYDYLVEDDRLVGLLNGAYQWENRKKRFDMIDLIDAVELKKQLEICFLLKDCILMDDLSRRLALDAWQKQEELNPLYKRMIENLDEYWNR